MHDLVFQDANFLIGPEIRDLRNSVSHLSHHVAPPVLHPALSSLVLTPPPNPISGRPSRPNGPSPPAVPRNIPPQPVAPPPTCWYANGIHGGTSEFDQAVAANAAARRVNAKARSLPLPPLFPKS